MAEDATVLVLGASRGLGFALAEEWLGRGRHVIATIRGPAPQIEALQSRYAGRLHIEAGVDITDAASVRALRRRLEGRTLDVLFVNAGICKAAGDTPATVAEADFLDMMLTNALSPVRAAEVLEDLVAAPGVIAVMTSQIGSITNATGKQQCYGASKAALSMLMKCFAERHADDPRAMLLVAPGWVRTDMGGPNATLSIEECIPSVADVVEKSAGAPGLRFIDRHGDTLPW